MSSSAKKKGGGTKLKGKAVQLHKQSQRENEAREILELNKRISQEAPPQGSNPLSFDTDPSDSFTPSGNPTAQSAAADAAAADAANAASSSTAAASSSNKAAKAAKRESSGSVLYGAVRKFDELPISQRTKNALTAANFIRLTDIQRAAIPHALAGRDILGSARTGSGKTLAYLVPVLEKLFRERWSKLDGIGGLIIVPTRELAMQIFDVLRVVGKTHRYSAGLVIGGKDVSEEQDRILTMNLLICTPGRILQHFEQTYGFHCDNLQILVLDEADRILDMGFSQTMSDLINYFPPTRQTLLFSATQTKSIKQLAQLSLKNPEYIAVHESHTTAVPNKLIQQYTIIDASQKINLLYSFIKTHLTSKSIVFLSSGKQVRFLYEIFRRIRPGVPLLHIHGKMKQQKRMAIYYDYCNKNHALMFCTDLAARGLDFPDVDWVVQMDAPENVPTYIHRVGRTARYRSGGKSLLFLLPSEIAFIQELLDSKKIVEIKKVKADPSKMKDVTSQFGSFLAENTELKYLAQKAFISYVRSVALQSNKQVFQVEQIPFEPLATSMGLIGTPKVKLPKSSTTTVSAAHREKNLPHALRQLLAENKEKAETGLSNKELKRRRQAEKYSKDKQVSQVDKILSRKNTTVFSETREKLRAADEEDDDDDEIMQVKRKDHDLSEGEDDSSDEDENAKGDENDEDEEQGESPDEVDEEIAREMAKKVARRGPQIQPKSIADASDAFLSVAQARVKEQDPQDRQRERERVKAKHQAKKQALKRKLREEERERRGEDGTDGVVVTLGRDGDDEDGGDDYDQDVDNQSMDDGSDDASDAEEEKPSSKKGKPSSSSSQPKKKQKIDTIADQEALALRILGGQ